MRVYRTTATCKPDLSPFIRSACSDCANSLRVEAVGLTARHRPRGHQPSLQFEVTDTIHGKASYTCAKTDKHNGTDSRVHFACMAGMTSDPLMPSSWLQLSHTKMRYTKLFSIKAFIYLLRMKPTDQGFSV